MHPLSDLKIYIGQKDVPEGFDAFTAYKFDLTLTTGIFRAYAPAVKVLAQTPGVAEGTTDNVAALILDDGRLLVTADHHRLPSGPIWAKLTVHYPDGEMPDGTRTVVTEWDTGIVIDRLDGDVVGETEVAPTVFYRTAYDMAVAQGFEGSMEKYQRALLNVAAAKPQNKAPMGSRMCKGIIRTTSEPGDTYVNYGLVVVGKDMITTSSEHEVVVDRAALDRVIGLEPGESCDYFVVYTDHMEECEAEITDDSYTVCCNNAFGVGSHAAVMAQIGGTPAYPRVMMGGDGKIIFGHQVDFNAHPAIVPPPIVRHNDRPRGLYGYLMQRVGVIEDDDRTAWLLSRRGVKVEGLLRSPVSMWGDQRKLHWSSTTTVRRFNPHTGLPQRRFFRARYKTAQKVSEWAYFEVLGVRQDDGSFKVTVSNLQSAPALLRPWRAHANDVAFDVCIKTAPSKFGPRLPVISRTDVAHLVEAGFLEDVDVLDETTLTAEVDSEVIDDNLTAAINVADTSIFSYGDILYFPEVEASEGVPLLVYFIKASSKTRMDVVPLNNFTNKGKHEIPEMPKGTPVQLLQHNGVIMAGLNRVEAMALYGRANGAFGFWRRRIRPNEDTHK